MSSNRKGFSVGMVFLVLIVAVAFAFSAFHFLQIIMRFTEISAKVNIFLETDDRGTLITSFLHSKTDDLNYAEIIGVLASGAKKQEGDIDKDLNHTLGLLNAGLKIYVNNGKQTLWRYGDAMAKEPETDIAVPGGKRGIVKLEVGK